MIDYIIMQAEMIIYNDVSITTSTIQLKVKSVL